MQKQPLFNHKSGIDLVFAHVELNPEFPVSDTGLHMHVPDSNPLTFLHYHDTFEIGYCYKGSGIFIVDNKIMPFTKGDASIIFKNELHIAKSNPEDPSSWFFVYLDPVILLKDLNLWDSPHILAMLNGSLDFKNIISKDDENGIASVIFDVIEEMYNKRDMYRHAVKGLILSLLAKLSRVAPLAGSCMPLSGRNNMIRLSPALDYIFRNYSRRISIPELAEICEMSTTNFRRIFTKTMNITPNAYINRIRIRMASVLLAGTGTSILDISLLVGYESLSSFNRHFKAIMGMSPREWRRQFQ